uniref:Response regulator transcription factor n=1 Tax=Desulfacinum infernum TaxID=35837 RepID=A0A831ZTD4_9BACT
MEKAIRVLVIDDDWELCALLEEYLGPFGFSVMSVHDGEKGFRALQEETFDVVILDVMLPGRNGLDILRALRARSDVPVLMLTARGEDVDRIVGLELGADDYLPKPFNPRELLARLRALLRRSHRASAEEPAGRSEHSPARLDPIVIGDVSLSPATRTVLCGGEVVPLTTVEFNLLEVLMRSAGQVVPREDLSLKVLGRKLHPYDRSLDVHVSNLRKKLGDSSESGKRIKTVRSVGYLYVCV